MEMRVLGASALEVSAIGLGHSMGADDFSAAGRAAFDRLIARALALGLNFFDSSDAYWNGLHETWLGAVLGPQRQRAVLSSKFGNITLPDGSKAAGIKPE